MAFPTLPEPRHVRQQEAYERGRTSYIAGEGECPFAPTQNWERIAFWDGWYDAKHERAMERIGETWSLRDQQYFTKDV